MKAPETAVKSIGKANGNVNAAVVAGVENGGSQAVLVVKKSESDWMLIAVMICRLSAAGRTTGILSDLIPSFSQTQSEGPA